MKTRLTANVVFAFIVAFAAACISEPPMTSVAPTDCPNGSTDPECVEFCEDNPNDPVCTPDGGTGGGTDGADDSCVGTCADDQVCDETTDTCVACLVQTDCETGVCVEGESAGDNACAECADSSDCTEPAAARCVPGATPADNACGECDDSEQCSGIAGLNACNIDTGECVECVQDSDCEVEGTTFACDLRDNTCSTIEVESVGGCKPCVSDSSCKPDTYCVELTYNNEPQGYYCMPEFDENLGMCPRPYGATPTDRQTLGGETKTLCLLRQLLATCEAIDQFDLHCPTGNECTATGSSCKNFNGIMKCTYACASPQDCFSGVTCDEAEGAKYCGIGSGE